MERLKNRYCKKGMLVSFCIFYYVINAASQTVLKFNALTDIELSAGGEQSHYYYNEIDNENLDLRLGFSQLNLMSELSMGNNWSLHTRFLIEREKGKKFDRFIVPQLNIQWLSKKRKAGITFGLFTNPFGSFNEKQLSIDRRFISNPLAYSYYINISPKIGYHSDMGDVNKISADGVVQWGSSHLHYGGYSTGFMFSWNVKPSKINWKLALVNRAANVIDHFPNPFKLGVVSKLSLRPTYFWHQAFSLSYGGFMENSEYSEQLENINTYSQTLIGTDFKIGKGFFECSGEFIAAIYKVAEFDASENQFVAETITKPIQLNSYSAYLDMLYEFNFFPGSYIAYRIDRLGFGDAPNAADGSWDNDVWRHSIAGGYHFNDHVLLRLAVSRQSVANKDWDKKQDTVRLSFTAHY